MMRLTDLQPQVLYVQCVYSMIYVVIVLMIRLTDLQPQVSYVYVQCALYSMICSYCFDDETGRSPATGFICKMFIIMHTIDI